MPSTAEKIMAGQHRSRPADERFPTFGALRDRMVEVREHSSRHQVDLRKCHVAEQDGDFALVGSKGKPARLTHFSFGQLCSLVKAPGQYISELPPKLGIDCLNHSLRQADDTPKNLLVRNAGDYWRLSGINGPKYSPIWNGDILDMFSQAEDAGWKLAHENSGYAADHNMVAFLANDHFHISDGSDQGLKRGLIIGNSEVGAGSFFMLSFAFRGACSNMMIFGMKDVEELRIRHVGDADRRVWHRLSAELERYTQAAAGPTEALIKRAQAKQIAKSRDKVIEWCFGHDVAPKAVLEPSYDLAEEHADTDGDPRTVWGLANGITRYSQTSQFGDKRLDLDRSASRLFQLAA